MYLLFASAYPCIAWHIPPLIPFRTINNILTSVSNSNIIPVFSKHAYHVNPVVDKNEQDQVHISQYIYF